MNGKAERLGQTLHQKASTMLKDSGLSIIYWPELISTANSLRNRQPVTGREVTPYEANIGRKPQLGHLQRVGQYRYAQVRKPNTGWKKFQDRAIRCILLGYKGDHIYRMLTPNNKVLTFSNVKWIDNEAPTLAVFESEDTSALALDFQSSKRQCPLLLVSDRIFELKNESEPSSIINPPPSSTTSSISSIALLTSLSTSSTTAPRAITRQLAKKLCSWNIESQSPLDPFSLLALISAASSVEPSEPKTYKKAVSNQNAYRKDWQRGMQKEIDSINKNKMWIVTDLPIGQVALDGKLVYKIKRGPDGEITHYKARWVVKRFQQREGINYHETFASVVKPMSYKAIFAIATARD